MHNHIIFRKFTMYSVSRPDAHVDLCFQLRVASFYVGVKFSELAIVDVSVKSSWLQDSYKDATCLNTAPMICSC